MNRLVLIGNGFDLAHNLPTKYEHFINWYWNQRWHRFVGNDNNVIEDILCKITCINDCCNVAISYDMDLKYSEGIEVYKYLKNTPKKYQVSLSDFMERIINSIETKNWVDIENEYYKLLTEYALEKRNENEVKKLNAQLKYIQDQLVDYLKQIEIKEAILNTSIRAKIYAKFDFSDFLSAGRNALRDHIDSISKQESSELEYKFRQYGSHCYSSGFVERYRKRIDNGEKVEDDEIPIELLLPNKIMLLSFNYTKTAELYCKKGGIFQLNYIHGKLVNPKGIIFGYGDEVDENYKKILNLNENECLKYIKSVRYMEANNYHEVKDFIDSEPFQIYIMGHSCGNSDRSLLNTLFEHKNCVSIKPYYHQKSDDDNYLELVQNIRRNFSNIMLMQDRVVNKEYCEPLTR